MLSAGRSFLSICSTAKATAFAAAVAAAFAEAAMATKAEMAIRTQSMLNQSRNGYTHANK
jgi:hypothetical protein